MTHTHPHSDHPAAHDHGSDGDGLLDLLDLDGQVLHEYWDAALSWVARAAGSATTRVLDLGAGTGTGTLGLSARLADAEVVAADLSAESLLRVQSKAAALGLGSRVRTLEVDLDAGWPELDRLDLTWASMSMHHFADPDRVLRDALAATRPGGLLAISEFSQFIRFLPADLDVGRPGLEDRIAAALESANAHAVPELGSAWAPRLRTAGWQVVEERDFVIDLDPPQDPAAGRYAHAWFTRLAAGPADQLDADDRAALATLLDTANPKAIAHRADLHLRGIRTVTLAARPASA